MCLASRAFVGGKRVSREKGGERKKEENHFMEDTVKDLFEQATSLSVLLY